MAVRVFLHCDVCALCLCCLCLLDAGGPEPEGIDIGTSSFVCPMVSGQSCSVLVGTSVVSLCPCNLSQPHSTHREASRPTAGSGLGAQRAPGAGGKDCSVQLGEEVLGPPWLGAPLEVGDCAARRQGSHELSTHPSLPHGQQVKGRTQLRPCSCLGALPSHGVGGWAVLEAGTVAEGASLLVSCVCACACAVQGPGSPSLLCPPSPQPRPLGRRQPAAALLKRMAWQRELKECHPASLCPVPPAVLLAASPRLCSRRPDWAGP